MKILEARDRVGGVNWTVRKGATHTEIGAGGETQVCTFDEGMYVNGGPWRIPHWHDGVLGYCKELGVPLEMFINEAEASYFYYEGDNIGPLANKRVRLREVKADMIGYTCELHGQVRERQDNSTCRSPPTTRRRFVAFLVNEGYLDSANHAYHKNSGARTGRPERLQGAAPSGFGTASAR